MTPRDRRKALSPIVSVILLILVAVGATVILYGWLSAASSRNPTQASELYERVKIDAVSYNGSEVVIYVRNIGEVPVTIVSASVLDATTGTAECVNNNVNLTLDVGQGGNATINSCQLGGGTVYIAKVVTKNGVEATYTFTVEG
jgi:FlaG/FlaF family flagellin (archaellin)